MIKPLKWNEDATDTTHANAIHTKVSELIDAVNELEEAVYASPNDDECDDICPDCWAETEPFIANLPNLSDEQLIAVHDCVADLLDQRLDDDGYCEQCNDYHDLPGDDDEDVTGEIQKVVDDVRGTNQPREIDTTDGLFSEFVAYVAAHPKLRFWQAMRNWSGYSTIYGVDGVKPINLDTLEDTFYLKTKGPKKVAK